MIDDGLARRLKALACTAPLHDLDARKTRLEFAEAGVYQMAEIAFQVIDQVTVAMDFDTSQSGTPSGCGRSWRRPAGTFGWWTGRPRFRR